jgi:hypothetical protein
MSTLAKKILLFLIVSFFGIETTSAAIIIQNNWQYTTVNASATSDAAVSYQPLDFTNLLNGTSATGAARARASEDNLNGNDARVSLVYSFDFLLDTPTLIGLSDHLVGFLSLGDTDSAHVDTFVRLIDQATNAVVASLPFRNHTKSGTEGTDPFDESTPFSLHAFYLRPGDYLLQAGLNVSAHATFGLGDDAMESNFSYTVAMRDVPEPSTVALMVLGGLGVLLSTRFSRPTYGRRTLS